MEIVGALLLFFLFGAGILCVNLLLETERLKKENENVVEYQYEEAHQPNLYVMFGANAESDIYQLSELNINAHLEADIKVKNEQTKIGYKEIVFENNDICIIYEYDKANIVALSEYEKTEYNLRVFFDNKLPLGAERAIIKQLGLLGYMVNIGFHTDDKE